MPVRLNSTGGGSVTLDVPATAGTFTINLPAASGSIVAADGSGNVGIGTASPAARLDVVGNMLLSGQSTAEQFIRVGSGRSANGFSYVDLQGDTTYPTGLRIIRGNSGANSNSGVEHRGTGALQLVTYEAGPINFFTSSAERMRIDASGNVGIGTSSPGNKLDIVGAGSSQIRVKDGVGATAYYDFGRDGTDGFFGFSGAQTTFSGYKWSVNAGTEVMRITNAGNVGIGTSTPTARLDVNGSIVAGTANGVSLFMPVNSAIRDTASSGSTMYFDVATGGATHGAFDFRSSNAFTSRMLINSSGALLVNTSSELGRVTVRWNNVTQQGMGFQSTTETYNGSPIVFYNSSGGASGFIGQATSFVSYNTSSDYRLKENITPLTDAAARVQALKPSRFNFIADPGRTIDGFIAHEAAEVVPEAVFGEKDAVNEDGSIKAQGIDQSKLVPLLTAALQEALSRIEALEARLAAVEAR